MVSYGGSFTAEYRAMMEELWRKELDNKGIAKTDNISMAKFLGDDIKI